MTRLRPFVVGVVVACVLSAVPLLAQGPFAAQIEQFWQLISTGGRAFTNLAVAAGGYATFGPTLGSTGYGIRDSAGTLQFSNAGGTWAPFANGASLGTCPSAYNIACSLETWTTPASNVGTTTTVLATYTLPANTLSANGQALEISGNFSTAYNTNTKTWYAAFGAASLLGNVTTIHGAAPQTLITVTRISATTAWITADSNFSATIAQGNNGLFTGFDFTAPITFTYSGKSDTASGDITFETGKVQWLPAGGLN